MLFLIIVLITVSVTLSILWFLDYRKSRKVVDRLRETEKKPEERLETEAAAGGLLLSLRRLAVSIGVRLFSVKIPFLNGYAEELRKKLLSSRQKIKQYEFIGLQALAIPGTIFVSVVLLGIYDFTVLLLFSILGFFSPYFWLNGKVKKRHMKIFKNLPDALDILTLLVEAGLDFNAALNQLIENETGPLIDEFYETQQEIKLGKNRITALSDMSKKVNNKYLTSVIGALTQSMQTGSPIGPTLRSLSDQFRSERALLAEKLGQEAPMKMMIPLILLIFPTIFIMIFGPIVLSFIAGRFW